MKVKGILRHGALEGLRQDLKKVTLRNAKDCKI